MGPGGEPGLEAVIRRIISADTLIGVAIGVLILLGLYLISLSNYLLFHATVELAGIAVAFAIFVIVWNTRRNITDTFFLLTGISFLFIGGLDFIHTLAYKGMGVFPGDSSDLPTQLWIAARYFQSITFLVAALLIGKSITKDRKYDAGIFLAGCTAATALLLTGIFISGHFPHAFIEGSGLTPFKIGSEYVISLIMLVTIGVLILRRNRFDRTVWWYLIAAQVFLIAGELAFTSYISVYGFMNMLGHLFRLVSVYFFYRAIVVVTLTRPFDTLFRELRENEETRDAILTAAKESIFLFGADGTILLANETALSRLGNRKPGEVIGHHFSGFMTPELARVRRERLDEVIATKKPVHLEDVRDGIAFDHTFFPVFDDTGTVTRIAGFSRDVTDRKRIESDLLCKNEDLNCLNEELTAMQEELRAANEELTRSEQELTRKNTELAALNEELTAIHEELRHSIDDLSERERDLREKKAELETALAEKEVLLSEIHHRVKNNLTAFISLLSLEGSYEETESGRALKKDLQNRARSMALIHETLYRTGKFSSVEMEVYLTTLVSQIAGSYAGGTAVRTLVEARGIVLDLGRATTAGLIINELVTNSFKYAFPPGFDCMAERGEPCTIRISFTSEDGSFVLTVADNGRGLPPGFDPHSTKSLGLKLVNFLARHQLRAEIEVRGEKGTEFRFRLDRPEEGL